MREQFIHIDEDGDKYYYSDKEMTVLHREDGPAIEYTDGSKSWYIDGKCHREDGPAIEWVSGTKEWCVDGKRHREDGPAIEYTNGGKSWYIDGKKLTEEQFNARNKELSYN